MAAFLTGIGIALFLEGLVFALAPSRLEDLIVALARLPLGTRRALGLGAMALGLVIVAMGLTP